MGQSTRKLHNGRPAKPWTEWLRSFGAFALVFVGTELILHILAFGVPDGRIVYPVLFGFCLAALCSLMCFLFPPLVQGILGTVLAAAFFGWAVIQFIYQEVFGAFMPLSQLALGGNIVDFRSQLFYCLGQNIPKLLLLLLPLLIWLNLLFLRKALRVRVGWRQALAGVAAACLFAVAAIALMLVTGRASGSVYQMLRSSNTNTTYSYRAVGMTATTAQELRFMLFPAAEEVLLEPSKPMDAESVPAADSEYNLLPIDFDALAASTDDKSLKKLDAYFAGSTPTRKNEYTGLLQGGNVIVICAESFSPLCISEELTPTLYKLSHGGFVFKRFYGCFESVTTNGEYTTCTGLFPDLSRKKVESTFDQSIGNYLPFCLGNALGEQGYLTYAYHNYIGGFYNRNLTHANMGFTFKAADSGLDVQMQWPASDLEMIRSSVDDYIDMGKPFAVYYMTFSGHYQYDWYNAMSVKNRDRVEDLPYSDTVKAYIACNLELEDAMTCLVDRLEQAGLMDKTLIVLTNDHYPYGLKKEQYNELARRSVDTDFEKFRNSFICYTEAVDEPVVVDSYCCTADILPTILNLMGCAYDSRLMAGTDVLSDGDHVAILETGSFLTQRFRYNAFSGAVTPHGGDIEIPQEEVEQWRKVVAQKMELSRQILNHDYYSHVFSREGVIQNSDEAVSFTDIESIFTQASAAWIVSKGFMDPLSNTEFGAEELSTLGEFLDSLYRIAGRPAASEESLPPGYGEQSASALAFSKNHPYHDAVCWAFAQGLIRENDAVTGFDDEFTYMDAALILSRFCELYQIDVHSEEEYSVDELLEKHSDQDPEALEAMAWCFSEHIIGISKDLDKQIEKSDEPVTRGRLVNFLFYTCMYELHMD